MRSSKSAKASVLALVFAFILLPGTGWAQRASPALKAASIGHGIVLHYIEAGSGPPVIFVHGSLSDYTYWDEQISAFAEHYHVIAYSRRYNFPNTNPARPGYSAVVDAQDLAQLIGTLKLGKVSLIGHSYGALTALLLATKHPELIRAAVLAEPPVISLLAQLPGEESAAGKTLFLDIQRRMVVPMKAAFSRGESEAGVSVFINYVFDDPHAWDKMPQESRRQTLRDAREWDVMMPAGTLFPNIEPQSIRNVRIPVLLLSGGKSYAFLQLIDAALQDLLQDNQRIVFPEAGHQMWLLHPQECRDAAEEFLRAHRGNSQ
jgi:pimeloyl-ACP methyl ester carboxylesterase